MRDDAGDLVGGELILVVPLVAILAVLTAWPAGITERSFPAEPARRVHRLAAGARAVIDTPSVDWLALSPTLALLAVAGITLLGAVLVPRASERAFSVAVSVAGLRGVGGAGRLGLRPLARAVGGRGRVDDARPARRARGDPDRRSSGSRSCSSRRATGAARTSGEYYALLAAAAAGMVFFVSAANLMTMFLALEWFSISLYVLCALDTHRRESLEAGLKYLIVGSFGSGVLLFGCALVYGATGELGFAAIRDATGADDPLFVTGMAMILAGLAFKVSAAPFHMWTPDVYQGAPTTVTAFMSAATKIAGLVLMLRILVTAFPEQAEIWSVAVAVLAVCSLAIGNFAAIAQRDVKRLLAYSSDLARRLPADRDRRELDCRQPRRSSTT